MVSKSNFRAGSETRIGSSKQHLCKTRGLLRVPQKSKPFVAGIAIDQKHVSGVQLIGRYQPCQWIYNVTLDCPFQMPGSVFQIRSFAKQKLSRCPSHTEAKAPRCRIHHTLLHLPEFDLKHFIKLRALERMKHHHPVQAIHKLRRELPSRRLQCSSLHLRVPVLCRLVLRLDEPHAPVHQISDLPAS